MAMVTGEEATEATTTASPVFVTLGAHPARRPPSLERAFLSGTGFWRRARSCWPLQSSGLEATMLRFSPRSWPFAVPASQALSSHLPVLGLNPLLGRLGALQEQPRQHAEGHTRQPGVREGDGQGTEDRSALSGLREVEEPGDASATGDLELQAQCVTQ